MRALRTLLATLTFLAVAQAHGQTPSSPWADGPVLFVCEHGTVKSLLAKLLFDEYAAQVGLSLRAESRGVAVDPSVPPWMRAQLASSGLPLGGFRPLPLRAADLSGAAYVVSFDLPGSAVAGAKAPHAQWDSLPAASQQFEASRDAIKTRVRQLVDSLARARRVRRPAEDS